MLIDHMSLLDHGPLFRSAMLLDGLTRIFFRPENGQIVATVQPRDNYARLFYMRLTPEQRHELEGLGEFGGDAVYRGRLPFVWNDELNEARATEYLHGLEDHLSLPTASSTKPPITVPEQMVPTNLKAVEMVRPDAPHRQQVVRGG